MFRHRPAKECYISTFGETICRLLVVSQCLRLAVLSVPSERACESKLSLGYSAIESLGHRPVVVWWNYSARDQWKVVNKRSYLLWGRGLQAVLRITNCFTEGGGSPEGLGCSSCSLSLHTHIIMRLMKKVFDRNYLNMLCISLPAGPREAPRTLTSPPFPRLETNRPISSTLSARYRCKWHNIFRALAHKQEKGVLTFCYDWLGVSNNYEW